VRAEREGEVDIIPGGWVAMPCFCEIVYVWARERKKEKKEKRKEEAGIPLPPGSLFQVPWSSSSSANSL
jgi:hypothetical protein